MSAALGHAAWWLGYQIGASRRHGAQDVKDGSGGEAARSFPHASGYERGEADGAPEPPGR